MSRGTRFLWPLCVFAFASTAADCGKERLLPRPEPLRVHRDGGLSPRDQTRLADVRRFLGPYEQQVLERTLENLAQDPHLPGSEVEAALTRALSGFGSASDFCARLQRELQSLALTGPEADAPATVALAVSMRDAHERWLSPMGRERYPEPRILARALRDDDIAPGTFASDAPLGVADRPLFVTDAAELAAPGPSAAQRLCLEGPPASSYVVASIPTSALPAPLRVPTAADAVCRPKFTPAPRGARAGITCSGRLEYVTASVPVGAASGFRISR